MIVESGLPGYTMSVRQNKLKECLHMAKRQLNVQGSQQILDQMKYEIASEFGVQLGADTTARQNGAVGGEITKRLIQMALNK
jgi:hypothetical protein